MVYVISWLVSSVLMDVSPYRKIFWSFIFKRIQVVSYFHIARCTQVKMLWLAANPNWRIFLTYKASHLSALLSQLSLVTIPVYDQDDTFARNIKPLQSFLRLEGIKQWQDTRFFHGYTRFLLPLVIKICRRAAYALSIILDSKENKLFEPARMNESFVSAGHFFDIIDDERPLKEAYVV